jgi:hypothetical protein
MAVNYANMRALAARLISENGKPITLTRTADGVYNPATGGTSVVTSNIEGDGVLLKYSNKEIDGTTILSSDRKMIYSGAEPKVDDRYINERIVSVMPLDPDESGAIMYTCQLRK